MQKKGTLEENCVSMGVVGCYSRFSSASKHRSLNSSDFSVPGSHEDILNVTPRPSHHSRSSVHLERRLHDQNSRLFLEKTWGHSSSPSIDSLESPQPKPTEELVDEIAALELEVIKLERYLLSLYRTAFDQHLAFSLALRDHISTSPLNCQAGFLLEDDRSPTDQAKPVNSHQLSTCDNSNADTMYQSRRLLDFEKRDFEFRQIRNSPAHDLAGTSPAHDFSGSDNIRCPPRQNPKSDMSKAASRHHTLADHLGASIIDHVLVNPCKLSEDIVRCISAIYCKLSSPPTPQIELLASPVSSLSSSATFSPLNPCDNWSPQCLHEAMESPCQLEVLKDKDVPYSGMVKVPKICVDGDKFDYAATMLERYRALIRHLEIVDPRKMEHNEKLAFWINIHNALVMHAFLAFGLEQDHMKSTPSILKASYIIGGHSINARVIPASIFGCQSHHPELWPRTLLLLAMKFMRRNGRHVYAFDRPEPLVHFALSLGAYSDPAVRVYRAKSVFTELELARDEFIQANIRIHKETRVILPKILQYYAKDASLNSTSIWEMVSKCMTEAQKKAIQGLNRRRDKSILWASYDYNFRYTLHRDLTEQ